MRRAVECTRLAHEGFVGVGERCEDLLLALEGQFRRLEEVDGRVVLCRVIELGLDLVCRQRRESARRDSGEAQRVFEERDEGYVRGAHLRHHLYVCMQCMQCMQACRRARDEGDVRRAHLRQHLLDRLGMQVDARSDRRDQDVVHHAIRLDAYAGEGRE